MLVIKCNHFIKSAKVLSRRRGQDSSWFSGFLGICLRIFMLEIFMILLQPFFKMYQAYYKHQCREWIRRKFKVWVDSRDFN